MFGLLVALLLLLPALLVAPALIVVFSRLSRWQTLAHRYPLRGSRPPARVRLGFGVFRGWIGYNGGLVVAVDARGLYLAAMPVVLSFCHPPIFIPWSEIEWIRRTGCSSSSPCTGSARARPRTWTSRCGLGPSAGSGRMPDGPASRVTTSPTGSR